MQAKISAYSTDHHLILLCALVVFKGSCLKRFMLNKFQVLGAKQLNFIVLKVLRCNCRFMLNLIISVNTLTGVTRKILKRYIYNNLHQWKGRRNRRTNLTTIDFSLIECRSAVIRFFSSAILTFPFTKTQR